MNRKLRLGYVTFPSEEAAINICRQLVSEGLIACANILPAHVAIYGWNGALQQEKECAAIFKTTQARTATITERVRAIHPYQTPAVVFVAIEDGSPDFLKWIYTQTL